MIARTLLLVVLFSTFLDGAVLAVGIWPFNRGPDSLSRRYGHELVVAVCFGWALLRTMLYLTIPPPFGMLAAIICCFPTCFKVFGLSGRRTLALGVFVTFAEVATISLIFPAYRWQFLSG